MNKTLALFTMFLLVVVSFASATVDISVESISVSPSEPIEGQSISVSVTLANVGDENVTAGADGLTLDFDDGNIATENVPALDVGETKTVSFPHTYSTYGTYQLVATYTLGDDNAANDEATEELVVAELNLAPVVEPIDDAIVILGNTYTEQVIANDPNGDALTYSLSGPAGMSIEENSGFITWTPTSPVDKATVVVSVSDGQLTTTSTFLASAKIDKAEIDFVGDELNIGGPNQIRGSSAVATIEVENTGTKTISALDLELTDLRNNPLGSEYNAFVSLNQNTLAPGEKALATVSITVPEEADARQTRIGRLTVTGVESTLEVSKTIYVNLQAESFLEITDVEIRLNGQREGSYDDGDTFDEALEGDEITLEITVENIYSDRDDDIEDVYVQIEDSNWDIDEESSETDIAGDRSNTFTLRFTIDDEIYDDDTAMLIRTFGEDGNDNFEHYDEWELFFEIEREDDDIRIKEISFSRNPVDCTADSVTMDVTIQNYGEDDQDEIFIYAYSDKSELDWNQKRTYIELESREETTRSFVIDLPSNVDEDIYMINVEVKYDISKDADEQTATLEVICSQPVDNDDEEPEEETEEEEIVVITPPPTTTPPTGNVVYGQPASKFEAFTETTTYLVLLIFLALAILIIIAGWAMSLGKKR